MLGFNMRNGLLSNLKEIPLQLGKDYLYQKIGGDWLGIDRYKSPEDQEMTPFQKQLLGVMGQNNGGV